LNYYIELTTAIDELKLFKSKEERREKERNEENKEEKERKESWTRTIK
jgi:hypothetical protein